MGGEEEELKNLMLKYKNKRIREYKQKNKEMLKKKRLENYQKNNEVMKKKARDYYANNKDKIMEIQRRYGDKSFICEYCGKEYKNSRKSYHNIRSVCAKNRSPFYTLEDLKPHP